MHQELALQYGSLFLAMCPRLEKHDLKGIKKADRSALVAPEFVPTLCRCVCDVQCKAGDNSRGIWAVKLKQEAVSDGKVNSSRHISSSPPVWVYDRRKEDDAMQLVPVHLVLRLLDGPQHFTTEEAVATSGVSRVTVWDAAALRELGFDVPDSFGAPPIIAATGDRAQSAAGGLPAASNPHAPPTSTQAKLQQEVAAASAIAAAARRKEAKSQVEKRKEAKQASIVNGNSKRTQNHNHKPCAVPPMTNVAHHQAIRDPTLPTKEKESPARPKGDVAALAAAIIQQAARRQKAKDDVEKRRQLRSGVGPHHVDPTRQEE